MRNTIPEIQRAVEALHHAQAIWIEAVAVSESFLGRPVWEGKSEVFDLKGHPEATRCCAWVYQADRGATRYMAVLDRPPVDSPEAALRTAIVADSPRGRLK